jgi:superoxide dismutase, Cu-Zn family
MRSVKAMAAAAILAAAALATGIGAALASGGDDDERSARPTVATTIYDTSGKRVGVAFFRQRQGKVAVTTAVWGLPAGFHGFHVHTTGLCEPPSFSSAGGHFNPTGADHGDHAGDLPSLLVNGDGTGELHFATDRFTLDSLLDADGSALMVHADRDNYANIPADRYIQRESGEPGPDDDTLATGDAGERAACGVIERSWRR